jgi:hypothetical protein
MLIPASNLGGIKGTQRGQAATCDKVVNEEGGLSTAFFDKEEKGITFLLRKLQGLWPVRLGP